MRNKPTGSGEHNWLVGFLTAGDWQGKRWYLPLSAFTVAFLFRNSSDEFQTLMHTIDQIL